MKTFAILATLALIGAPAADDDLAAATKKTSELTAYGFKFDVVGGKGKARSVAVEGKFQKDQPAWFKASGTEVFKKIGQLIYKDGEEWKKYEKVKGAKGEKKRGVDPSALLEAVKLPHEEIQEFEKNFKEVKKAEQKENDCTVFSGELTEQGASSLGNTGAKGKAQITFTGSAKLSVNADGLVVKYSVDLTGKGKRKDRDVELKISRTVELSDIGTAKIEVPEPVKKLLEGTE
jgi:hypothetical protein